MLTDILTSPVLKFLSLSHSQFMRINKGRNSLRLLLLHHLLLHHSCSLLPHNNCGNSYLLCLTANLDVLTTTNNVIHCCCSHHGQILVSKICVGNPLSISVQSDKESCCYFFWSLVICQ